MSEAQTADLALMRELNERIVLNLIRQQGPISRAELARRRNLSRSTISSIINTLITTNLVHETGMGDSQGGRRPIMLAFNYQSSYVIGVELATTTVTVLLTDLAATVQRRAQRAFDIAAGPDVCLPQIVELIAAVVREAGVPVEKLLGVGVGVPGPLAYATGRPVAPPVMPGWHNAPLRRWLERALHLPIFVENDANLGALAEHRWGAAQGWHNLAYVYLGSAGIGAGLILDGRLYRGDIGSAGEIGHLIIDEDGPLCPCGSFGCLEAVAGTPALRAQARALGLHADTICAIVALAQQGDPQAIALIRAAGEQLGIAIASLLNMINPGCVVLGGDLTAAGALLLEPLQAMLRRCGLTAAVDHVAIGLGTLGDDVVAIGAVSLVVQHIFSTPSLLHLPNSADQMAAHELALRSEV
jgi:predicted NBD/HSP70 family sugar kinase